jgi:putative solute:sodium symporter small subunit
VTVIESGQPAKLGAGRTNHRGGRPQETADVGRKLLAPIVRSRGGYAMAETKEEAHWRKTTNLMLIHLGVWFFFGFIIHMFVYTLNKVTIPILGFPLGFYMAAQGSLIVFVVQLFLFAKQQDKIDREFGFAEDDA